MDYQMYFHELYPHINEVVLDRMEKSAKEILVNLLFPSTLEHTQRQKDIAYSTHEMWICDCMQCFIDRNGMNSAVAYSENGLSIKFSQDMLSTTLINLVRPVAGLH